VTFEAIVNEKVDKLLRIKRTVKGATRQAGKKQSLQMLFTGFRLTKN
jgi:hypothetical protein